jgi:hypothetical protein
MGILGVQVVVTMIVASFLHKLSPYYSFGRWLAVSDMRRYVPPRDSQLQAHVCGPGRGGGGKKKLGNGRCEDNKPLDPTLTIPKSSTIELTSTPMIPGDLQYIHYYQEFRWLMDVAVAALAVYVCTCAYYSIRVVAVVTEYNLSVIWLGFLLLFALTLLFSLTSVYFSDQLSRERSLIIVFTTLFFVLSLGILLVDEDILHFRLRESHTNITRCVGKLLRPYISDIDNFTLFPVWAFKMMLAVVASLLSAMLVFPSFRYSELQFNVTTLTRSVVTRAAVRLCYLMPLFCLGMWIKPFAKDLFSELDVVTILGREMYHETLRHWSVLFYCGLRTGLFKLHLQNYLELAALRVEDLRREPGRITILQLRKKVSTIFAFYGGVGVQYMAPVLVILCLSVLMHVSSPYQRGSLTPEQLEVDPGTNVFRSSGFGVAMFHGCLSFLCWWACFTVFIASGFGSALRSYL